MRPPTPRLYWIRAAASRTFDPDRGLDEPLPSADARAAGERAQAFARQHDVRRVVAAARRGDEQHARQQLPGYTGTLADVGSSVLITVHELLWREARATHARSAQSTDSGRGNARGPGRAGAQGADIRVRRPGNADGTRCRVGTYLSVHPPQSSPWARPLATLHADWTPRTAPNAARSPTRLARRTETTSPTKTARWLRRSALAGRAPRGDR